MRDIFMPYRHLIPINDNCFRPLKMPIGTGYRKSLQFIYGTKNKKTMKGLSILAAFLGGAVVGAAAGILFAPESGEDTRSKIADALRKRGIKLSRTDMENLVDEIAAEVKE